MTRPAPTRPRLLPSMFQTPSNDARSITPSQAPFWHPFLRGALTGILLAGLTAAATLLIRDYRANRDLVTINETPTLLPDRTTPATQAPSRTVTQNHRGRHLLWGISRPRMTIRCPRALRQPLRREPRCLETGPADTGQSELSEARRQLSAQPAEQLCGISLVVGSSEKGEYGRRIDAGRSLRSRRWRSRKSLRPGRVLLWQQPCVAWPRPSRHLVNPPAAVANSA